GVIGLRGSIVPVFDLAAVLGHPSGATPRWSVVTADDPPLALAVSGVDGQLRVPAAAVSAHAAAGFVAATVATPRGVRPVIDLGAVHAAVRNETGER
ncbi:MAG TPA: chemotaxis protein CheW, partial [Micromonosporaceae bacterium]|nr:chemotaxis protein CheW [Micromonosporaceae bacterium]